MRCKEISRVDMVFILLSPLMLDLIQYDGFLVLWMLP